MDSCTLKGVVVGDWKVRGLLGRGGAAEVYRVDNCRTGECGALKIAHDADSRHVVRFEREKAILTAGLGLRFPRLMDSGTWEGRPYFVLEILHAHDALPQTDKAVACYVLAVCEGLRALHAFGFVHRDVKAKNILFRKSAQGEDEPVLIDFGLVTAVSRQEKALSAENGPSIVDGRQVGVGTLGYAAPEQFMGGDVSPAMDVHALGVLVTRCFNGSIPISWRGLVRQATSSLPEQRFQTIDAVMRAISFRHWLRNSIIIGAAGLLFVLSGALSLMAWVDARRIRADYVSSSLSGERTELPGLSPRAAKMRPDEDAALKIESMLRKAERQYAHELEAGGTNHWQICLPDFANAGPYYRLTNEIREKYGQEITNLYKRIELDAAKGKCGRPYFMNICRTLF